MKTSIAIQISQTRDGYIWTVIAEGSGKNIQRDAAYPLHSMQEAFNDAMLYTEGLLTGLQDEKGGGQ